MPRLRQGRYDSLEARIAPSALLPSATSTARRRASRPTRRAAASSAANSTSTRVDRAMARSTRVLVEFAADDAAARRVGRDALRRAVLVADGSSALGAIRASRLS